MSPSEINPSLLDQIVREVLAALSRGSPERAPAAAVETPPSPAARSPQTERPAAPAKPPEGAASDGRPLARIVSTREGELVVTSRVVTLSEVEDRLDGVRRLVVPPKAVITPAVRDVLAERRIQLARAAMSAGGDTKNGGAGVTVLLLGSRVSEEQIQRLFTGAAVTPQCERYDCLIRATDRAAEGIRSGARTIIVTQHLAPAVCLANRHAGVRAVAGRDAPTLASDAAAVGANVAVIDPSAGLFALKRSALAFLEQGPWECPEAFRERLG